MLNACHYPLNVDLWIILFVFCRRGGLQTRLWSCNAKRMRPRELQGADMGTIDFDLIED